MLYAERFCHIDRIVCFTRTINKLFQSYKFQIKSLFNHCFELLHSIVGKEQRKNNYDYDECFADFNDCVNQADWTIDLVNGDETFLEDKE